MNKCHQEFETDSDLTDLERALEKPSSRFCKLEPLTLVMPLHFKDVKAKEFFNLFFNLKCAF